MPTVKMFWWNEQPNFGDALNPVILQRLFGITTEWSDLKDAQLVGAGSCLQWVASEVEKYPHDIHIWGTGYMFDQEPPVRSKFVTHHVVRGRNSKEYGNLNDVALGDPGTLSPLLLDKPISKKYRVGIVPHLWNMNDAMLAHLDDPSILIIDVTKPAVTVVEEIASCEFIYSSSLHGLIVADSFGIPNQWVEFSKKLFGGSWKFNDYYSVYAIKEQSALAFESRLTNEKSVADIVNEFELREGIDQIQRSLLTAFPESLKS